MIKCHSQYWSIKTSTHSCVSFSQQNKTTKNAIAAPSTKWYRRAANQLITISCDLSLPFSIFMMASSGFIFFFFFWGGGGHFTLVFWKFIPITLQQKYWIWMKLLVIERHEISTLPVTKIWGLKPQIFVTGPMVPNCLKPNSITNYYVFYLLLLYLLPVIMFFPRQLKTFVFW